MLEATPTTDRPWPGFDQEYQARLLEHALSPAGEAFRKELGDDFFITHGRGIVLGPPQFVRREAAGKLRTFARAYHRCMERVVAASRTDEAVRDVLATPEIMRDDLAADTHPVNGRIHLFRLDLLVTPEGDFQVLENNANCPGGIIYTGIAARGWRQFLGEQGFELPSPLPHEDLAWMARWFVEAAEKDGAGRPELVGLLHEQGGNDIELREYAEAFAEEGIEAVAADPRDLRQNGGGPPTHRGRPMGHAYLKLGFQPFLRMRSDVDVMVHAVRERRLFVQNGLRGRWVGDSKLCLAVLSDPAFAHLFEPDDLDIVAPHVPWSRNAGRCPGDVVEDIRGRPERYVLKRGLDTRGRGVVVGAAADGAEEWNAAVDVAIDEGWLVQEFCETTETRADFDTPTVHRHDLAVGIVDGEIGGLFMRSSGEYKVNVAQNGRLHPVFEVS